MFVFIANKKTESKPTTKQVNEKSHTQFSKSSRDTIKKNNQKKTQPKNNRANKEKNLQNDEEFVRLDKLYQKRIEKIKAINKESIFSYFPEKMPVLTKEKMSLNFTHKGQEYEVSLDSLETNRMQESPEKSLKIFFHKIKELISELILKDAEVKQKIPTSSPIFGFNLKFFALAIVCTKFTDHQKETEYESFPLFRFSTIHKISQEDEVLDEECKLISLYTINDIDPEKVTINEYIVNKILINANRLMNYSFRKYIFCLYEEQDTPRTHFPGPETVDTNHSKLEKLPGNYFEYVVLPIKGVYNMIYEILKDAKLSGIDINSKEFVEIIAQWLAVDEFGQTFLEAIGNFAINVNSLKNYINSL